MNKIFKNMMELIGKTPMVMLSNYAKSEGAYGHLIGKLEYFNPAGSVKDRLALALIAKGEEEGLLKEGSVIIEPTSGNTGIGLAAVGAVKGYKVMLTMPDTMSIERRSLLEAYGAQLILTEGSKGMQGAIDKAAELAKEIPGSIIPGQFTNPANPEIHRLTTGPEIWEDMEGLVDIFVAGIGTGGTITGVGEYLKACNQNIKIVAIEPEDSPILSRGKKGPHKIQGIGAGFIPKVLNTSIYDEIITVKIDDALETVKKLSLTEGLLVGISSGGALWAAAELAKRHANKDKNIVVLLPDGGERYLSNIIAVKDI